MVAQAKFCSFCTTVGQNAHQRAANSAWSSADASTGAAVARVSGELVVPGGCSFFVRAHSNKCIPHGPEAVSDGLHEEVDDEEGGVVARSRPPSVA
jgi:hypothetical protein